MAQGRTAGAEIERSEPVASEPVASEPQAGFGAEFRELARQRRFVREPVDAPPGNAPADADARDEDPPATGSWRDAVQPAPPRERTRDTIARPEDASGPAIRAARGTRISEDQRAVLAEFARMSDRLVESREALALQTARADRAESDLTAANDRLMAARVLVQDAQHATRMSAERCAWLEGRCETLQEALDLAVNASVLTRWRWRRQLRRA